MTAETKWNSFQRRRIPVGEIGGISRLVDPAKDRHGTIYQLAIRIHGASEHWIRIIIQKLVQTNYFSHSNNSGAKWWNKNIFSTGLAQIARLILFLFRYINVHLRKSWIKNILHIKHSRTQLKFSLSHLNFRFSTFRASTL